jgi:hypothetical protein
MYIDLHVKYMLYLPDLMKFEFSGQVFEKHLNIKFNDNSSSASRVIPSGRTDGRAGMTKLVATFWNFANAPKTHS